jgi:ATP-dependent DNA helicase RecQ
LILGRVTGNDPKLRIIITTIALGMGVDMQDVVNIYHWGVPDNVLQYWQEIGRGGRNGKPATAVLFVYGPSTRNIQKCMKDLIGEVKEKKCVRRAVLSRLCLIEDSSVLDLPLNPRCCSVCSA